ncbi:helix-turn-helix domain-containing protein [Blastococcus goldschmidtiae]|uniref:Leucine zipper domain-containing protein n=1 Tax=Blastococcus goldschmidtiae TaxID=3075546 RepID=A0ABU2K800_9ACTN|nr:leucine zipper domain-containing protein [Blastococcus sp. DSM 46792]MDT0276298.1 leucine zipper domain-containing protein [Blastococcus sp. DSM 46792]
MSHANARLTPAGRLTMVERIASGRPAAHVAAEMGVSRATASKWWRRWLAEGRVGLVDRSSIAHSHPARTPACTETRIRISRLLSRRGPVAIGAHLNLPASTVGRVLTRHQTPRLAACDPVTGQVIRATRRSANRYEHDHPGALIHLDVKKLGRIPDGGGWRAHGRSEKVRGRGIGYDYIHAGLPRVRLTPHL